MNIYGTNPVAGGLTQSQVGNGFVVTSPPTSNCFTTINAATPNQTGPRTCTLIVTYNVPASGVGIINPSSHIVLNYLDGVNTSPVTLLLDLKAKIEPRPKVHFALMDQNTGDQTVSYMLNDSSSPVFTGNVFAKTLTLWNDSPDFPVSIIPPSLQGGGAPSFQLIPRNCASGVVPAGGVNLTQGICQYDIKFTPGNTDNGPFTGSIGFQYRDEVAAIKGTTPLWSNLLTQSVSAFATTQIKPQPTTTHINFGTVFLGASNTVTVNFNPVGYLSPAWWGGLGALPPQVTMTAITCATNAGSGTPCLVTFQYSPSASILRIQR